MNANLVFPLRRSSLVAVVLGFLLLPLRADSVRTQTVSLQAGWNAVFLEVYPADSDPAVVFAGTPVDVAAAFYARESSAQFVTNPGADLFRQAGWGVWYAADRPDAFLASLHAVYGNRAYLIHATADYHWQVTGSVVPLHVRWQPDAYNLVGFPVASPAAPTFAQFFAGSRAHRELRIYRLVNGVWQRLGTPDATLMRSGEAFWTYCDGSSSYQGPLRVETTTQRGLVVGDAPDRLILRNQTDHPITPTLQHVPAGPNAPPLSILIQTVGDETAPVRMRAAPLPAGPWTQALPPLEAGEVVRVPLEARREDMTSFTQTSLLKISTDLGTEVWIPIVAIRRDLEEN